MKLPENLSARTSYLLGRAASSVQALGEHDLEPLGITPREYSVLAVLAEHSPLSQTQVAEILGLDRTTILKLGASLERKRLVVRERDANDARAYASAHALRRPTPRAGVRATARLRSQVPGAAKPRRARAASRPPSTLDRPMSTGSPTPRNDLFDSWAGLSLLWPR